MKFNPAIGNSDWKKNYREETRASTLKMIPIFLPALLISVFAMTAYPSFIAFKVMLGLSIIATIGFMGVNYFARTRLEKQYEEEALQSQTTA